MKHPEYCYVFIITTEEIGIVKWGENGYYKTSYGNGYTQETVDEINQKRDISKAEAEAMQMCSMANLPETEEAWEKHYKMCLDIYEKHKNK